MIFVLALTVAILRPITNQSRNVFYLAETILQVENPAANPQAEQITNRPNDNVNRPPFYMNGLLNTIVGGLLVIIGGIFSPLISHWLTRIRERKINMSDLNGFLGGWMGDIEQASPENFNAICSKNIRHLRGYYTRYHADFRWWKRRKIKITCDQIVSSIKNRQEQKAIEEKISELIEML